MTIFVLHVEALGTLLETVHLEDKMFEITHLGIEMDHPTDGIMALKIIGTTALKTSGIIALKTVGGLSETMKEPE